MFPCFGQDKYKGGVSQLPLQSISTNSQYYRDVLKQKSRKHTNKSKDEEMKEAKTKDVKMQSEEEARITPPNGNQSNMQPITPIKEWTEAEILGIVGPNRTNEEFYEKLFEEELKNNAKEWYNSNACHLSSRLKVVDWICMSGIDLQLHRETIYRSIYYFDKICSMNEINRCHLQITGSVCLLIATKWNEKEEKVPSLRELANYCGNTYQTSYFKALEAKLLCLLDWSLKVVLPIDFINLHVSLGVVFPNDSLDGHSNIHTHPHAHTYIRKFTVFFMDIIAQEYTFWTYKSSTIAATVIVAARRALRIQPFWQEELKETIQYSFSDISQCFQQLWNLYRMKFPQDAMRAEQGEATYHKRKEIEPMSLSMSPSIRSEFDKENENKENSHVSDMKAMSVSLSIAREDADDEEKDVSEDCVMKDRHHDAGRF